jgi:hypothetical protein
MENGPWVTKGGVLRALLGRWRQRWMRRFLEAEVGTRLNEITNGGLEAGRQARGMAGQRGREHFRNSTLRDSGGLPARRWCRGGRGQGRERGSSGPFGLHDVISGCWDAVDVDVGVDKEAEGEQNVTAPAYGEDGGGGVWGDAGAES